MSKIGSVLIIFCLGLTAQANKPCNAGYSRVELTGINKTSGKIESSTHEVRGDGLYYTLNLTFLGKKSFFTKAVRSTYVSATVEASAEGLAKLGLLRNNLESKKIATVCAKSNTYEAFKAAKIILQPGMSIEIDME